MTPKERFMVLARFFLDGLNPRPSNFPALLDLVLAVPAEYIPDEPALRYLAHSFVRLATVMEGNSLFTVKPGTARDYGMSEELADWMEGWFNENVPGRKPS